MKVSMPFFEADGIRFHYLDSGAGLPFVFQHGMGGDIAQTRGTFAPPLPFRLLTLECRGHGETWPLGAPEQLSFDGFSDDLLGFMNFLGVEQALVGGISMGAGIALNFALRYPQRVRGLVLVRPAWLEQPLPANLQVYARIAALIRQYGLVKGREVFMQSRDYLEVAQSLPVSAASLVKQFERPRAAEFVDLLERLPADAPNRDAAQWAQMGLPTLVLANERDPVHPLAFGQTLARAIPQARFEQITSKEEDAQQHQVDIQRAVAAFVHDL
jgi:pimeloyl-ACP methyl ester carboxylesterase